MLLPYTLLRLEHVAEMSVCSEIHLDALEMLDLLQALMENLEVPTGFLADQTAILSSRIEEK